MQKTPAPTRPATVEWTVASLSRYCEWFFVYAIGVARLVQNIAFSSRQTHTHTRTHILSGFKNN